MRVELKKIHNQLDTTIIYVTHDQTEAMTLGTKIVVMKDGEIQQVDTPQNIYSNPINKFVAGFVGSPSMNFIACDVEEEAGKVVLIFAINNAIKKIYPNNHDAQLIREKYMGKRVILGIRPEDIYEYEEAKKRKIDLNSVGIEEEIVTREMLGAEVMLYFEEQNRTHAVKLGPENKTRVGEKIQLFFDTDQIHIFDIETGKNILYRERN